MNPVLRSHVISLLSGLRRAAPVAALLAIATVLAAADGVGAGSGGGATPPAGGGGGAGGLLSFPAIMMIMVAALMYFMMIRPQKKEEAKRKELIAGLKQGDKVTTIGGAVGVVVRVGEETLDLNVGAGDEPVVVRFTKGAVNASAVKPAAEAVKGA
jgi:preprotein translocase subunit YajC